MLSVRPKSNLPNYSQCTQTITIYNIDEELNVKRTVIENGAFYGSKKRSEYSKQGTKEISEFLVVVPQCCCIYVLPEDFKNQAGTYTLKAFDKIFFGVGPEITSREEWSMFLPSIDKNVFIAKEVNVFRHTTAICHVEVS